MQGSARLRLLCLGLLGLALTIGVYAASAASGAFPAPGKGCIAEKCHAGIEPIRQHQSTMAQRIYELGKKMGDPNGCVVCHGGNPAEEKDLKKGHAPPPGKPQQVYIPFPGSMGINQKTCGQCHPKHVYALHRSVMQTETGKIQGAMWGWGAQTGYKRIYGNYDIKDSDGPVPVFGTKEFKAYTQALMKKFPYIFPSSLKRLPKPDVSKIKQDPGQAVLTYLRSDCQRCHVGVKGRDKRGDMRGMGCAACHVPYSNEGYYEGGDKAGIPKDKKNHVLVHMIQSSRKAKVTVNGRVYSGIPHETCASCHNRGKRIGVSFQGIMEFPYGTPWTREGKKQPQLHTKRYLFIQDDVHHRLTSRKGNPRGGLLCQDCHTTVSMHGSGNISGTTLANVEIECSDCHGTAAKYPWELPLGWGDEFGRELGGRARGLAQKPLAVTKSFGTVYPPADGYLITTRGNPFGNVVRRGDKVIVHSASGLDFEVPTLRSLALSGKWQNPSLAIAAKVRSKSHIQKLECYACHSAWAPQCYGCHVKVDYSKGQDSTDWVAAGNRQFPDGTTGDSRKGLAKPKQPGKASEARSWLRWENPVLGVNGEGRVSPIIPGCQQILTVIGPDGETLLHNRIFRTPPGMEGGGKKGQRGIDMAPAAPHTTTRQARSCASCHASSKALGYGTHDGRYNKAYPRGVSVDVATVTGQVVANKAIVQIARIPDLPMDLDQVVTRDGRQLQTVGHHWPLSAPLSADQRRRMERAGVCISCHRDVPDGNVFLMVLHIGGRIVGLLPETDQEHQSLINRTLKLAASVEVMVPLVVLIILLMLWWSFRRRRRRRKLA